jgi:serpin B
MDVQAAAEVQGISEFSVELYQALLKINNNDDDEKATNLVMSPLSIAITLAMALAGAKGATRKQIAQLLKLPQEGDPLHKFSSQLRSVMLADAGSEHGGGGGPLLKVANRVWVEQSLKLKPTFQKLLKNSFGSEAGSVDFIHEPNEAREEINAWAKEETCGRIENLLPEGSINNLTRLLLTNALYFKGTWQEPFAESNTKDREFYLLDGRSLKVPMMQTKKKQHIKSFETFKALRLPYSTVGNDKCHIFSMYILLPHEKKGLLQLEQSLDPKVLSHDLAQITREVPVSDFQLPKFKIKCGFEVFQALQSLGLTLPFLPNDADFTEMLDSSVVAGDDHCRLYISDIFQKAFVEVNEKGTEAAAATGVVMELMCYQEPEHFVADHPFLFIIKEESTNVILFIGHVTNPTEAN